jgi:hypothetical protein
VSGPQFTRRFAALPLAALVVLMAPTTASAEICGGEPKTLTEEPPGQICLVNPPSAPEPWPALPTFQLRVPSNINRIDATWRGFDDSPYSIYNASARLIAPGPPGGKSLWQGAIIPFLSGLDTTSRPHSGTVSLSIKTWAERPPPVYNTESEVATFSDLPVRGLIDDLGTTIKRQGKRYVASFTANVGAPATAKVTLYISASKSGNYDFPGKPVTGAASVAAGAMRATAQLPLSRVLKKCRPYRHCTLRAYGHLFVDGLQANQTAGPGAVSKVK